MEAVCTARESEEVAHVDAELKRSVWRFLNLPPPHDPLELRPESGASWGGTRARKTDDALLAHVPVLPITRAPRSAPPSRSKSRPTSTPVAASRMPAARGSPRRERIRPAWPRSARLPGAAGFPYLRHGPPGLFVTICECFLAVVSS
jgi:hypothetical protein